MTLGGGHFSSAAVPRRVERIAGAFTVRAVRPRTWQLAVLMTMLGAGFH